MDKDIKEYFEGKLMLSKEEEIRRYMAENSDNVELSDTMYDIFEKNVITDNALAEDAFNRVCGRLCLLNISRHHSRIRPGLMMAAAFASAVCLFFAGVAGYSLYDSSHSGTWMEIRVPDGESSVLTLSDGTELRVSPGSRVTYPEMFRGKERIIFLDGELFADVAKDDRCPFVIKSGNISVNVVGTRFIFKSFAMDRNAHLQLLEGSVRVDIDTGDGEKELLMQPGDFMTYDRTSGNVDLKTISVNSVEKGRADDNLMFYNDTFEDIARTLERRFGVRIVVTDKRLAESRFVAFFSNGESLETILSMLNGKQTMKIEKVGKEFYIGPKNQ